MVSHLPRGDWRIGAPFYFCAALQAVALALAWIHFRRQRRRAPPRRAPPVHTASPDGLNGRPTMHDKILILDFGSQVTQLIARRVREAHVYCEIHPNDVSDDFVREFAPKGIILSGSHASTYEDARPARAAGGVGARRAGARHLLRHVRRWRCSSAARSSRADHREFGYAEVRARGHTRLLDGIEDFTTAEGHGMLKVWMSHGDKVTALPPGFKLMASTPSCPIAGMADEARGYYAVQFHPEVTHTLQGRGDARALRAATSAARRPDWVMGDYIDEAVARIREQVGDEEVHPRPVGRRRFERRRGADPPRHRRPADLRLRRPRPAAPRTRRAW